MVPRMRTEGQGFLDYGVDFVDESQSRGIFLFVCSVELFSFDYGIASCCSPVRTE